MMVRRALAGFLTLSFALSQIPVSVSAVHACSGTPAANTTLVLTAAGQTTPGCTSAGGCGPTLCCTGVSPALSQAQVAQTNPLGSVSVNLASPRRVPRLLLGGPPTPPPNS